MPLGTEVGLVPTRHCVRWGTSSPSPKGAQTPDFRPMSVVAIGQTAGWTMMPLGMEVGLGPGDFVFDGGPATPEKGHTHPPLIFRPTSIVAKRLHGQDATWYGGRPRPTRHSVRWGPNSTSPKGAETPDFRPMSVVAKRQDGL